MFIFFLKKGLMKTQKEEGKNGHLYIYIYIYIYIKGLLSPRSSSIG
jgi:hypothetical protein